MTGTRTGQGVVLRLLGATLALLLAWPTWAADAGVIGHAVVRAGEDSGAAVVLDQKEIFRLYHGLGSIDLGERALLVNQRLQRLRDQQDFSAAKLVADSVEGNPVLRYGDNIVLSITAADAEHEALSAQALAQLRLQQIGRALQVDRAAHSWQRLLTAAAYSLLACVGLWLTLRLLGWAVTKLRRGIRWAEHNGNLTLRIQQAEILPGARIAAVLNGIVSLFRFSSLLLIFYLFTPLILSFFPGTQAIADQILGWVLSPLKSSWNGLVRFLPDLFVILVTLFIMRSLTRLIGVVFREIGSGSLQWGTFDAELAEPTFKIIRFLLIIFTLVLIFPYLPGSNSEAFKGASVFLGVLFSLGSSSAVANVIAGVVLTYTRAFHVGDRVKIGEHTGDVIERSLLVTRVRTIKNVEIAIPNASVLGNPIANYSILAAGKGLILHTTVTIGYDVPWRQVHELLLGAVAKTEGLLSEPAAFVLQTSLDDFFVSYQVNAYTQQAHEQAVIYSNLHQAIQDGFRDAQVEIMSPHYRAVRDGNVVTIPERS